MELIACQCDVGFGLPHDHHVGFEIREGVYQAMYDPNDIGRMWVDWKAVAQALMRADADAVPA